MRPSAASYRFGRRIARRSARPPREPGALLGIETEFEIFENGERADFRTLIDDVVGGGDRRWFPLDSYARFLPSGAVVTCDEREAEIATPPVRLQRGIATVLSDEVLARRAELLLAFRRHNERTGRRLELRGYSTHLNAFCPPDRAEALAETYARTVSPAMMLLLDLDSSPGALVRPRGRRIEIGGEYVAGRDDLRVATLVFITSLVGIAKGMRVAELNARLLEDPTRGGWFVDRTAFGDDDLYVEGRMAALELSGGGHCLAGTLLGETWAACRRYAEDFATAEELALVDDTVAGTRALPLERDPSPEPETMPVVPPQEFATILRERRREDISVAPVSVSWEAATVRVTTPVRSFYARVPAEGFTAFATAFERGSFDRLLRAYSMRAPAGRVVGLETPGAGLYDETDLPGQTLEGKAPRIEVRQRSRFRRAASTLARRTAAFVGAVLVFGGSAAFAYYGLRDSASNHNASRLRPPARVLGTSQTRGNAPTPTKAQQTPGVGVPAVPTNVSPPAPNPNPRHPGYPPPTHAPTPAPTTTHAPSPPPTPTPPPPTHSPTPTPTPTPTGTPADGPLISGSVSCSFGTSQLSFTVTAPSGAPRIKSILVQYNSQQQAPAPSPSYPMSSYSGSASAAVTPGSNHIWTVVAQDESGRAPTHRSFPKDKC